MHSGNHADGAVVAARAGDAWPPRGTFVEVHRRGGRVTSVRVVAETTREAPPLWYVAVPEPDASPPAYQLVAFSSGHRADGDVIHDVELAAVGVRNDQQVAAFRWWPESGMTHQVYVQPAWRRRGIGHKLVYAVAGFAAANGWPRLQASGQRTDDGHALATGVSHIASRVPQRTHVLPSMTPAD
ncbi:MAG: hypothetical protein QOE05_1623 [Actinomycetota bacterium]|nr:hypothetical protein [Actinomycetota bacterium]